MLIAAAADLHLGSSRSGDQATHHLLSYVSEHQPDLLLLGGDLGEDSWFRKCLRLCRRTASSCAATVGNHDIWMRRGGSSRRRYEVEIPRICREEGVHLLDEEPLACSDGMAILGSMNWYDYSLADETLLRDLGSGPEYFERKLLPRGSHNDGRFVRLGMSDKAFTELLAERLRRQLDQLDPAVDSILLLTHHPAMRELCSLAPPTALEARAWMAYGGNLTVDALVRADSRIRLALSGHTHHAISTRSDSLAVHNIGGDYDWKRLLWIDTHSWEVSAIRFTAAGMERETPSPEQA